MEMIRRMLMPWMSLGFGEEGSGGGGGEEGNGVGSGGAGGDEGGAGGGTGKTATFEIPQPFREKGWTKNIKSAEDLWKKADGLVELQGKKSLPPKFDTMTPNEIEDYFKQSRPESPEKYEFPEGTQDNMKKVLGELLFNAGVDPYRAKKLIAGYAEIGKKMQNDSYSADGFDAVLKESFGDKFKETGGLTANFIKGNVTEADAKLLESLPNKYLGLIYRFANKVRESYGATEGGDRGGAGKVGSGDTESRKKEIRKQLIDLGSRPHSAEEKQKLLNELNKLYGA